MDSAELNKLIQERATLFEAMKVIDNRADPASKELRAEDTQEWERMNARIDQIDKALERNERLSSIKSRQVEMAEPERETLQPSGTRSEEGNPETRSHAFRSFLCRGLERLPVELRSTLQVDSGPEGGYLVKAPEIFISEVIREAMNDLVVGRYARSILCGYAQNLGALMLKKRISPFRFKGSELGPAVPDDSARFGKRELKPKPLEGKTIRISKYLLQADTALNVEQLIRALVAEALAEGLEYGFFFGNGGASEPLGIFIPSDNGIPASRDIITPSATGFGTTADVLIDVQHSIRSRFNPLWFFHRDAIKPIRKLKDSTGQYLWQPGLQTGQPNQILGVRYETGDLIPNTFTSNKYIGLYGDLANYWIANGFSSMTVQRIVELYSETNEIGFQFDMIAADGQPIVSEAFTRIKTANS